MSSRWFALAMTMLALVTFGVRSNGQSANRSPASGTTVVGTVVDEGLQPLAAVEVSLLQGATVVKRTTTDKDGAYAFAAVVAGRYRVRAVRSGLPTLEREFVVAAGVDRVRLPLVMPSRADAPADRLGGGGGRGVASTTGNPSAAPVDAPRDARTESPQRTQQVAGGIVNTGPAMAPVPPPPPGVGDVRSATQGYQADGSRSRGNQESVGSSSVAPGEGYARIRENRFRRTADDPLSTFGADVDTASFTNTRRFISNGQLPPADAVRVEEFVNYFKFDYALPTGGHPIGLTTEVAECPWEPRHKLVLIGARAVAPARREMAGRNIVLLIDVSGSMSSADKLPLVKSGLGLFVDSLDPDDRLAIVTYAGTTGVALPSTPARERDHIRRVIDGLGAGGSTNGAGGLIAAYRLARQAYIPGGVNRVILATDGDFNVGVTSHEGLLQLIEREKESGVFLSVLGVGTGNLQDATMELLADKGNGNYAYLDSLQEARRVLVREAGATMETVAKDVKFQVEFNPAEVASWKLVGYENRLLAHEDFNDDRKDGGEMGAGHSVTVLYEIVPVGLPEGRDDGDEGGRVRPTVDPLRYQDAGASRRPAPVVANRRGEWLNVKVRYQEPEGNRSRLLTKPVASLGPARLQHLPFASAVAEFGLLLREPRAESRRWDALVRRIERLDVSGSRAADRDALLELVTLAATMTR